MVTVSGYKDHIQATEEEVNKICDNCKRADDWCNKDINIKNGFMRCSKLSYDLQNKNGEENEQ